MSSIKLKLPGQPAIPITFNTAAYGNNALLYLHHNGKIVATIGSSDMEYFSDELFGAADKLAPRTVADVEAIAAVGTPMTWRRSLDARTITPAQVIAYFEQSPDLQSMAGDVRAALKDLDHPDVPDQLALDLAACQPSLDVILEADGSFKWGHQSRIAEILNISNAGQANRDRIIAVANALQNSTSTPVYEPALLQAA